MKDPFQIMQNEYDRNINQISVCTDPQIIGTVIQKAQLHSRIFMYKPSIPQTLFLLSWSLYKHLDHALWRYSTICHHHSGNGGHRQSSDLHKPELHQPTIQVYLSHQLLWEWSWLKKEDNRIGKTNKSLIQAGCSDNFHQVQGNRSF